MGKQKVYGMILAAGMGTRMGQDKNKMYIQLGGRPIIAHTLEAFYASKLVDELILVIAPNEKGDIRSQVLDIYPPKKPLSIVVGGNLRQDSVYNGLKALEEDGDIVAIQDGARPFITPETIDESILGARRMGAAVVGMPVKDTIKQVGVKQVVEKTLDRSRLWLVQTPQTFKVPLIMEAHKRARKLGLVATDDSALVESMGGDVLIIEGSYSNIKITTPEDIIIGEQFLEKREWNNI